MGQLLQPAVQPIQPLLVILFDVKAGSPHAMFPTSFFCPGKQPRFATCFTSKSKEGVLWSANAHLAERFPNCTFLCKECCHICACCSSRTTSHQRLSHNLWMVVVLVLCHIQMCVAMSDDRSGACKFDNIPRTKAFKSRPISTLRPTE